MAEPLTILGISPHTDADEPYPRIGIKFRRSDGDEVWGTAWLRDSTLKPLRAKLGTDHPGIPSAIGSLSWLSGMPVKALVYRDRRGIDIVEPLSIRRDESPMGDSIASILAEQADDIAAIREAIEHLSGGETFEIRRLPLDSDATAGHFRDPQTAAIATTIADHYSPGAAYISLCDHTLPVTNTFGHKFNRWDRTTRLRWLLIDIDPVKSGMMATDTERQHAADIADNIIEWLTAQRFPGPAVIDSGNGRQILFPCELDATDETRDLIQSFLHSLSHRFNDPRATIDPATANTPPQCRLPGTWNRKGDDVDAWRQSSLLRLASGGQVTTGMLESIVATAPADVIPKRNGKRNRHIHAENNGHSGTFDFPRYLTDYGIDFYRNSKGYEIRCPFHPHREQENGPSSKTVVWQDQDGTLCFKCLSSKCTTHGWKDFRNQVGSPTQNHFTVPLPADHRHYPRYATELSESRGAEQEAAYRRSIAPVLALRKAIVAANESRGCIVQVASDEVVASPSMLADIPSLVVVGSQEEVLQAAESIGGLMAPSRNQENCKRLDDCRAASKLGLSPGTAICPTCEHFSDCVYIKLREHAKSSPTLVEPAQRFFLSPTEFGERPLITIAAPALNAIAPADHCSSSGAQKVAEIILALEYHTRDAEQESFLRGMYQFAIAVANGPAASLDRSYGTECTAIIPHLYATARRLFTPAEHDDIGRAMRLAIAYSSNRVRDVIVRPCRDGHFCTATWRVPIPERASVVVLDHTPLRDAVDHAYPGRWIPSDPSPVTFRGWIQWPIDLPKATCRNLTAVAAAYRIARAMLPAGRILLVTYPEVAKHVPKHPSEFPDVAEVLHFHGSQSALWRTRSLFDAIVTLGTPRPSSDDVATRLTQAGALNDAITDDNWDNEAKSYRNPTWQKAYDDIARGELHRIARLADGRPVVAVTNETLRDATRTTWGLRSNGSLSTRAIADLVEFISPSDWTTPETFKAFQRLVAKRQATDLKRKLDEMELAGLVETRGTTIRSKGIQ